MCGPLRGFGVVQAIFAAESNLDKLARELDMDPAELRVRNALKRGGRWIFNQVQDRPAPVQELIERCRAMRYRPHCRGMRTRCIRSTCPEASPRPRARSMSGAASRLPPPSRMSACPRARRSIRPPW